MNDSTRLHIQIISSGGGGVGFDQCNMNINMNFMFKYKSKLHGKHGRSGGERWLGLPHGCKLPLWLRILDKALVIQP